MICMSWAFAMTARTVNVPVLSEIPWVNIIPTGTAPSMRLWWSWPRISKRVLPLVDGHGNFGSIEGDGAAAMRYTEARLQKVTQEAFLADLDKDVVDFMPNFDETEKEPAGASGADSESSRKRSRRNRRWYGYQHPAA